MSEQTTRAHHREFSRDAQQAVATLEDLARDLGLRAAENVHDVDLQFQLQALAAEAFTLYTEGLRLIAEASEDPIPELSSLKPSMSTVRDALLEHTTGLDAFDVLDFAGRFSDLYREVSRYGVRD